MTFYAQTILAGPNTGIQPTRFAPLRGARVPSLAALRNAPEPER